MTRGPGWPTVLGLTLVVLTFSVVHPLQLMMIPLAMLLVALPPRRLSLLLFSAALVVLSFAGPRTSLWAVERGWALMLGAYFLAAVVLWPAWPFVQRALAALAAAVVTGAGLIALVGGWPELDWMISSHYREVAEAMGRSWPGGLTNAEDVIELAASLPAQLFPAFIAVGSVAALAIAWWGYRRLARRDAALGRLVEFRFPDVLVWVLIIGLALLAAPVADWAGRIGSNLVFFMGALYALRGLGVLVAVVLGMVGAQVPVLLVLSVLAVFLYPIVVAGMLLLGVTDTWLDLRSGKQVNDEG